MGIKKEMDKFGNDQNNREGKNKFDAVCFKRFFYSNFYQAMQQNRKIEVLVKSWFIKNQEAQIVDQIAKYKKLENCDKNEPIENAKYDLKGKKDNIPYLVEAKKTGKLFANVITNY